MVVRAAREDQETRTQRTLSLSARSPPGPSTRTSEPGGKRGCRPRVPHPPCIIEDIERSCRCLGAHLAVQPVLCLEDPRTPTLGCRRRIRRRTSTEERTSRAQKRGTQVSCRGVGLADSARAKTTASIPTFLSGFPGLPSGRRDRSSILLGQMLSKARRPAALPSHACILGW